jgi:hypothetical protein
VTSESIPNRNYCWARARPETGELRRANARVDPHVITARTTGLRTEVVDGIIECSTWAEIGSPGITGRK